MASLELDGGGNGDDKSPPLATQTKRKVSFNPDPNEDEENTTKPDTASPKISRELSKFSKSYDFDGDGVLDETELALRARDKSRRGFLTPEEMYALQSEQIEAERNYFRSRKFIWGLLAFVVVLALSNLATSYSTAVLVKDTSSENNALVDSKSGSTLSTQTISEQYEASKPKVDRRMRRENSCGTSDGEGTECTWDSFLTLDPSNGKEMVQSCKMGRTVSLTRTFEPFPNEESTREIKLNICPAPNGQRISFLGGQYPSALGIPSTKGSIDIKPNSEGSAYEITGNGITSDSGEYCDDDVDCDSGLLCDPTSKTCSGELEASSTSFEELTKVALKEMKKKTHPQDVEECPAFIEDGPSCKVPDYCLCDGNQHEGCDQCKGSSSCVMLSPDMSICLPRDEALAMQPNTRSKGCQVEDYAQCGGFGYSGCQKCMPGSFCVEDDEHSICLPAKDIDRKKLKPLPREKVRGTAKLMRGINSNLDAELENESTDDEKIRWDMIRVFASEEGKERMKKLGETSRRRMQANLTVDDLLEQYDDQLQELNFTQDEVDAYESLDAEAEAFYRDDLCQVASNGVSAISNSTTECLCNLIEPALHCISLVGVEYEEYEEAAQFRRALLGKEADQDTPVDVDAFGASIDELRKEIEEALEYEEDRVMHEALDKTKMDLMRHPDFHGDVDTSLDEARRVLEEALRDVYHSSKYDFSEFGGKMGWHRDLGYCKLSLGGSDDAKFWAYASRMIDFVKTGSGCAGMDCAIPIPKTPLEVTLSIEGCLSSVRDTIPPEFQTLFLPYMYSQAFSIKIKAGVCVVGSDAVKTVLGFVGLNPCFAEGGVHIWPMNGLLNFWLQFNYYNLFAKANMNVMTTTAIRRAFGICGIGFPIPDLLPVCKLCDGGFDVGFEVGANFLFFSKSVKFGPWTVSRC